MNHLEPYVSQIGFRFWCEKTSKLHRNPERPKNVARIKKLKIIKYKYRMIPKIIRKKLEKISNEKKSAKANFRSFVCIRLKSSLQNHLRKQWKSQKTHKRMNLERNSSKRIVKSVVND